MPRDYRPNAALYTYEQNPQPQANAIDAALQGFSTGQGLGLRQRQQALLEQEAQRKQAQFEAEQKQKAIENLKVKADLYNAKWFKGMGKDEKNAFHRGFINDVRAATGIEIDPTSEYHDNDAETSQMLGEIFKDKNLKSDADRRAAAAAVLAEAQKRGSDKEYLDELRKTAEFGVGKNDELNALRMSSLQEQRKINNEFRIDKAVLDYSKYIDNHPVLKQINKEILSIDQLRNLGDLVGQGNTVAASALGTKMARAMSEVGVLTDTDIVRYVESGKLDRKSADKLSRMITGKPTDATLEEIQKIGDVLTDNYKKKVQNITDTLVDRLSRNFDIPPEEAARRLAVEYGKGDSAAGGGNTGGSEYQKDLQDAAEAIAQGVVTKEEAAKRIRSKYPNGAPR